MYVTEVEVEVEHDQLLEYKDIFKAAVPPLIYKSVEELKMLLFKGVLLNGVQTVTHYTILFARDIFFTFKSINGLLQIYISRSF